MYNVEELNDRLIDLAFSEDIGDGDHTTLCCIPSDAVGKSKLLIKEAGIVAGVEAARHIFNRFDPSLQVDIFINDGTEVYPGDVVMVVSGKVQSLLQTENDILIRSFDHLAPKKSGSISTFPMVLRSKRIFSRSASLPPDILPRENMNVFSPLVSSEQPG